jgi:hypothetical protein
MRIAAALIGALLVVGCGDDGGAEIVYVVIPGTGGEIGTGGAAPATGGDFGLGGIEPTGGTVTTGGSYPTGGAQQATGGLVATGGVVETGGTVPTGGVEVATGGTVATGGSVPTGGVPTGGSDTGGIEETGGTIGTGGSDDPYPECPVSCQEIECCNSVGKCGSIYPIAVGMMVECRCWPLCEGGSTFSGSSEDLRINPDGLLCLVAGSPTYNSGITCSVL